MNDDDGLQRAVDAARTAAETSCDPSDWACYHALNAAKRARSDAALLAALTEPATPETAPPPWSQVSRQGESEGPLPF
jgi:hypothetical protein